MTPRQFQPFPFNGGIGVYVRGHGSVTATQGKNLQIGDTLLLEGGLKYEILAEEGSTVNRRWLRVKDLSTNLEISNFPVGKETYRGYQARAIQESQKGRDAEETV